ncbi:MAG: Gfo/Idh/MocA family oxidoreductase [Pseudomonadota bacterium]
MAKILRAGVAGAGVFGGYHAQKYTEVNGATLAAIYDQGDARAGALAEKLGVTPFSSFEDFLAAIDIVTIATPASTHGELAIKALEAGKHVLVEKPLALDLEVAAHLIKLAADRQLTLQVGHQERYVANVFGLFDRPAPKQVCSRRLNKFSGRAMDVSVVFDLMIHDLDMLSQFTGGAQAEITRINKKYVHGEKADFVDVDLIFPSGIKANLKASRLEETPLRDLSLIYDDGEIGLNFLDRQAKNITPKPLPFDFDAAEKPPAFADPLRFGTQSFVNAVQDGHAPLITGEAGRAALQLALLIENTEA